MMDRGRLALGKKEGNSEAETPVRAIIRTIYVVANPCLELHGQLANFHELGNHQVQGNRPLAVFPVVSGLGIQREGGVPLSGVGDEGLEVGGVGRIHATAAEGPKLVG